MACTWFDKDCWVPQCKSEVGTVNDYVPTKPPFIEPIHVVDGCGGGRGGFFSWRHWTDPHHKGFALACGTHPPHALQNCWFVIFQIHHITCISPSPFYPVATKKITLSWCSGFEGEYLCRKIARTDSIEVNQPTPIVPPPPRPTT